MRVRGRAGLGWAGLVLVVGLGVGAAAGTLLDSVERHTAAQVMDRRTVLAQSAVAAEVRRYLDTLRTVAAGLGGYPDLSPTGFDTATAPLVNAKLVGATSIAFVIPARDGDVAQAQADWRRAGIPDLTLHPDTTTAEHYFTVLARPLDGSPRGVLGRDIAPLSEASAALAQARRTGTATVSDPYVLLRDRTLPQARQQLSFVLTAPVYGPGGTPFRGWVVMGMHGQEFVDGVVRDVTAGEVDTELFTTNESGAEVSVAALRTFTDPDLHREVTIPVADHEWTIRTAASTAALVGPARVLPLGTSASFAAAGVLLAVLVWVLAGGRDRALARVAAATAELSAAEATARSQAGLLGAVLEALTEGVSVVDSAGRVRLRNTAATEILSPVYDTDTMEVWRDRTGIYRKDGHTPFPVDELPLALALHGTSTDDVEMLVRNPARPEGVLISVSGRPLADVGGSPGAMAVFRDITALRAHEEDLTTFAGVVAHDLKAPLATIASYAELVDEELTDRLPGEPGEDARQFLARVFSSVDRAGQLIDDLLAYTTARDAPLHLATVDLDTMVEQVVIGRTESLRPGAPWPRITVGTLGKVGADPMMLRRVLDNLIGNAMKYVAPGEAPEIKISTEPADEPGWVRITVADRGIGIPDGDKPRVFESFHRAHVGAGYSGTGLGLAICRRIVQRHAGEITISDNPGGGTRVDVVLPAEPGDGGG